MPYGAGSEEHAFTATLTRRISQKLRLALKYGYFRYNDASLWRQPGFWGEPYFRDPALPVLNDLS